jgi:hypothetical protein
MKPEEFLSKLNKLPEDSRGSFSTAVLSLSKVGAAEAVRSMLNDTNFAVKVNAIKAIRKYQLTLYERELMQALLDNAYEVKIAAIKTLASFGNFAHYKLLRSFYDENPDARALIIDSFSNYSDHEEVYPFILSQITSSNQKVKDVITDWFNKAFEHQILIPWIANAYQRVPFEVKRAFEKRFFQKLPRLFYDDRIGYRLKLCYLIQSRNNDAH